MRILKFIGVFLGTLLLILLITFGFNLDALYTLYDNSEDLQEGQEWVSKTASLKGLTNYIGEQPEHVSLVTRSIHTPDSTITYGAGNSRTMGTLSNFFLITTYARLVENGEIDPEEQVSLESIDQYQLPHIDESKHDNAKNVLRNQGVVTSDNEVPLDDLVQSAIIYNDLAASDFLFFKLGQDAINQTYELLDLRNTDRPLPFSGLYITLHPDLENTDFTSHFSQLQKMSPDNFREQVLANTDQFINNKKFHERVKSVFDKQQGLGIGFTERRDILSLFPKSTAEELTNLMVELEQDRLISAPVSQRIKDLMDWPYDEQGLNNDFEYYGAIYDSRLGLLNGMDYGASAYSGEPFAQTVFFDSLQVAFWFHMSSNLMHQDYQQRLMWDPALRTTTLQEISK